MRSKHRAGPGEWDPPLPKRKRRPKRAPTTPPVTMRFLGGPLDGKTVEGHEEDYPQGLGQRIPMKGGAYRSDLAARCFRWEKNQEEEAEA